MQRRCKETLAPSMLRSMHFKPLLVCTLSVLLWRTAYTYPKYWYSSYDSYGLAKPTCDGQPTGEVSGSPHGTPQTDSSMSFTFTSAAGTTTDTLCPGANFTLAVTLGSSRLVLLTASSSSVSFTSPSPTSGCPNRVDLGSSTKRNMRSSFTTTFTVPCSIAGSQLKFLATSVGSSDYTWLQNSRTVSVVGSSSDSGGSACASALAACGLAPSNPANSPPPPASTPPSSTASPPPPASSGTATSTGSTPSDTTSRPPPPSDSSSASSGSASSSSSPPPPATSDASSGSALPPPPRVSRSPSPPPSPKSSSAGSDDNESGGEDDDAENEQGSAAPPPPPPGASTSAASNSSGCTPSTLGYQCMSQRGKLTLHWSINTASAPRGNGCTPTNTTVVQSADLAKYGTLHMAVQAAVAGYVAIGFNSNPKKMYPSDIVLGWASGSSSSSINSYNARGTSLSPGNAYDSSGSWAYDKGVVRNAGSGVTTICFSRRLSDSRAKASPDLLSSLGLGLGLGASSGSATGRRRRLAQATTGGGSGDSSADMGLIWAVSPTPALVQHSSANVGGFYLDLQSGTAGDAGAADKAHWIDIHGALMAAAWALLLPLGTLLPAHRWVVGGEDRKALGKALWFWLHAGCQLVGMALFIAGFVIAFVKLGDGLSELGEAHQGIGIAVMAAAGSQVVVAFIRPHPGAPRRPLWNLIHHNLGRAAVLLAWANVYIGIYVYHQSQFAASYTQWIVPVAVTMGVLVLADLSLRIYESCGGTAAAAAGSRKSLGSVVPEGGDGQSSGDQKQQRKADKDPDGSAANGQQANPSGPASGAVSAMVIVKAS